jgi:hypothetical protein
MKLASTNAHLAALKAFGGYPNSQASQWRR